MDVIHLRWWLDAQALCFAINPWSILGETVTKERGDVNCPYCRRLMKEQV